jgi:hypothetical protein
MEHQNGVLHDQGTMISSDEGKKIFKKNDSCSMTSVDRTYSPETTPHAISPLGSAKQRSAL